MAKRGGKRHSPEQNVQKLRDGDAMLNAWMTVTEVVQHLGESEQTFYRWKNQHGGMKSEEAKRPKELEMSPAASPFGGGLRRHWPADQQRIRVELRLAASVSVATTKFVAKIASALKKPDGFVVVVESSEVQAFLDPLPVERLWGVGKVTSGVIDRLKIRTIGQLRQTPLAMLSRLFGASGEDYWRLARGIDGRPVVPDRGAKSISSETTFAEDLADKEILRVWLEELVEQVARRLRRHDIKGRTAELKVRFADFQSITRSMTLAKAASITQELLEAGTELLTKRIPAHHRPIRLLGFVVSKLDRSGKSQQTLFERPDRDRQQELDRVADQIIEKCGKLAIRRGTGLHKNGE